jgi:hypothetical protein
LYKTFYNTLHCGKEACDLVVDDNLLLPTFGKNYNKDMARYCCDLIQRIYDYSYYGGELMSPHKLRKEIELSYDKSGSAFSVIWSTKDTLFIIFRGTQNLDDWYSNLSYQQKQYNPSSLITTSQSSLSFIGGGSSVHNGFYTIYNKIRKDIIDKISELNPNKDKNIVISGHSLGAAVATLCAVDFHSLGYTKSVAYVFASPRMGNEKFSFLVKNISLYSIINSLDVVPTIPAAVSPNFKHENQPNMFCECGKILRFSFNWESIYNNHSLGIYAEFLPNKLEKDDDKLSSLSLSSIEKPRVNIKSRTIQKRLSIFPQKFKFL